MIAGLSCGAGEEKRAAIALSGIAIRMRIAIGRMHAQPLGTQRDAIRIKDGRRASIKRNRSDAAMANGSVIHIPCVRRSIGSQVSWELLEGMDGLGVKRLEGGDIPFIEGLGVFGQHDIAIVRSGGSSDARAGAPKKLLLFFLGAISEFFVGAARDAELAIRITSQASGLVVALGHISPFVLLLHPGVEMLDVEGNDLTESGDLGLQRLNGTIQQVGEQAPIERAQLGGEPLAAGQGFLDIEAERFGEIEHEMEAQLKHEQGVGEKKLAELSSGDQPFADADEEGFEGGSFGMGRPTTRGVSGLPSRDSGPIESGEKGVIVGDDGIMSEERGKGGLVKDAGSRYQSTGLLCWCMCCY